MNSGDRYLQSLIESEGSHNRGQHRTKTCNDEQAYTLRSKNKQTRCGKGVSEIATAIVVGIVGFCGWPINDRRKALPAFNDGNHTREFFSPISHQVAFVPREASLIRIYLNLLTKHHRKAEKNTASPKHFSILSVENIEPSN